MVQIILPMVVLVLLLVVLAAACLWGALSMVVVLKVRTNFLVMLLAIWELQVCQNRIGAVV